MRGFWSFLNAGVKLPRALLFDIDGTLTHGAHALPCAAELLLHLRKKNFPFLLLTNDANHSREEKAAKLMRRGIAVEPEEIVSSGQPLALYTARHRLRGAKALVLGELGNPCYAQAAQLEVTRDPNDLHNVRMVIIGEGEHNWQRDLNAALNYLIQFPKTILCSPNPDGYWPDHDNFVGIGAGGKARFLQTLLMESGQKREVLYFGKPYAPIFRFALSAIDKRFGLHLKASDCMVIGDNLLSDIAGANANGMRSALLTTGVTTRAQLKNCAEALKPDYVFDSLGEC